MTNVLYYGKDEPLPEQVPLRAGPLSMIYESGDLRYIMFGDQEILRRVYAAVRNQNWDTIPMTLTEVQMSVNERSFRISYQARHQRDNIDFVWTGTITGHEDGTVVFQFDGESQSTFKRNRIGFCVLHPAACAGKDCIVEHTDGAEVEGQFPQYIQPHQPFMNMKAITHEVVPGLKAEVRFDGDVFEMEDQRNWTDASYKTYCTPLELPYPVEVTPGTKVSQSITIKLHGTTPQISVDDQGLSFTLTEQTTPLPRIGLSVASHGEALTDTEIARLKAMNLSHLRVDLQPNSMATHLRQATEQASALDVALEVAVHLSEQAQDELKALRNLLDTLQPTVMSFLIFGKPSNDPKWFELARQHLGDYAANALIGGGTNAYFTELNRSRPPVDVMDIVCYSLNPQVHAFDNTSLTETLPMHQMTIESAKQFAGGRAIAVTPITLQPRFNPNATASETDATDDTLPPQVDVRQMSLYGAGWTAGSIKYIAQGDIHSVTYYETTGWRGVMEREQGSPDKFPAAAGTVFPLYHVLTAVGELAGGDIIHTQASDPLRVDGLALRKDGKTRLILANLTATTQKVMLPVAGQITSMDQNSFAIATQEPETFRLQTGNPMTSSEVELLAFAIVRIDL